MFTNYKLNNTSKQSKPIPFQNKNKEYTLARQERFSPKQNTIFGNIISKGNLTLPQKNQNKILEKMMK